MDILLTVKDQSHMEKKILEVSGKKALALPIDAAISFRPFVAHLRKRAEEERTVKAVFYRRTLEMFEQHDIYERDIPIENIHEYENLLEQMYICLSPPLAAETRICWGLSFPFQPVIFYGTSLLYELMRNSKDDKDIYVVSKSQADYHREGLRMVYSFILKRLYNFQVPVMADQYHAGINTETGLLQYYGFNVDTDFIDVTVKGDLPVLNFRQLYVQLGEGVGYEALEKLLPLELFRFRGIAVITVTDITTEKAVENIKKVRLARAPGNDEESYKSVIQSLKTLVRNSKIEFDLFPFVRINDEPVYGYVKWGTGVLFSVWGEETLSREDFRRQAKGYASNPDAFFSPDIFSESEKEISFLVHFRKLGVRSLALIPVFHDQKAVGVLCMHTWKNDTFDERTLALLEPAVAPIAQLAQIYIDEFNLEIENIIKEKFTSIQPAVQWRFNEAAWNYLHDRKKNLPVKTETIRFNEVYPLYGAIDIRNSTIERNKAIVADLDNHLRLLSDTLTVLRGQYHSSLLEEMVFKCNKWQQVLLQQQLNTTDENNLNIFLNEETVPYLLHLSKQEPAVTGVINEYLQALEANDGNIYRNKHDLEVSMQMITNAINNYFESEKDQLQKSYPCYFEKFRTDGVEYDIYIGQSIAPDKPFNHFHLKNLRLWQLSSMAAIAGITRALLPDMPRELYTTQLIFVHNHTIDISFRADERKFDVEGAYSIRYQMIKKRIDKVHVRLTNERLTQPGKIALIYFNRRDVEDYLPFIQYLQETGVLHPELEDLDLEDVQGLTGLKALRVGVLTYN